MLLLLCASSNLQNGFLESTEIHLLMEPAKLKQA
jgi:hypothetical protein